jgi:hypothetical protein
MSLENRKVGITQIPHTLQSGITALAPLFGQAAQAIVPKSISWSRDSSLALTDFVAARLQPTFGNRAHGQI